MGEHASAFIKKQLAPWPALATATQQLLRSIADRGIGQNGGHTNFASQKNPRVVRRGDFIDEIRPASYFSTMAVNGYT